MINFILDDTGINNYKDMLKLCLDVWPYKIFPKIENKYGHIDFTHFDDKGTYIEFSFYKILYDRELSNWSFSITGNSKGEELKVFTALTSCKEFQFAKYRGGKIEDIVYIVASRIENCKELYAENISKKTSEDRLTITLTTNDCEITVKPKKNAITNVFPDYCGLKSIVPQV